jgi:hypothetical protein
MLLKKADDKSKRLALLRDLQKSTLLDSRQKVWLSDQLAALETGIAGERDSAYYLDQYFKDAENHVLLHDLRFVMEGDVAQIDHLIINRAVGIYLIETKNYGGSVKINARGEFTMQYGNRRFGIESPIEQSHRHERILRKLLDRLEIGTRTGTPLECRHVVMFHPRAVIDRPPETEFDTRNIIKADQFPSWHKQFTEEEVGFGATLRSLANLRSLDTIKEWGEKLMRQHRPVDLMDLPEFMRPRAPIELEHKKAVLGASELREPFSPEQHEKRLVCLQCNTKITFVEGRFCWNNEARFKGGQYCREHQELFPKK